MLRVRGSVATFVAALVAITCAHDLLPATSLAQSRASVSVLGVGVDRCSQVTAALSPSRGGDIADAVTTLAAHTKYRNWLMGWLSGFNVGSVDGGLGAIDLTFASVWYFDALAACGVDSAATFSDAVAQLTYRFSALLVSTDSTRGTGMGTLDCVELIDDLSRPDFAYLAPGYANWAYGFLSGYNAFRTSMGVPALDLADAEDPFTWTVNLCRQNPSQHFSSSVSIWVLEAEARQDALPIPTGAQSSAYTAIDETVDVIGEGNASPFVDQSWLSRTGARTCGTLTSLPSGTNRSETYDERIVAMSWTAGYLTASERLRSKQRIYGIDLSRVEPQAFWNAIRERCRLTPEATLGAVAFSLELRRLYPPALNDRSTIVGFAFRPCGELKKSSDEPVDVEDAFSGIVDSLDLEKGVPGWIEGFLSAYNMAVFDGRLIAAPLDLTDVGPRGFETVKTHCEDEDSESLAVIDGVLAFARTNFPGLIPE